MIVRKNIEIFNADCVSHMQSMQENSIDLVVTSPYDNLMDYNNSSSWNFEVFKSVADQLYRIVRPCGVVVWIVNDASINNSETYTSFRQVLFFREIGFNLNDTMIWNKQSTSFPDSNRYLQSFEYMFVLSKSSNHTDFKMTCNLIRDRRNMSSGSSVHGTGRQRNASFKVCDGYEKGKSLSEFGIRFNVWNIHCAKGTELTGHPAQMPIQIAEDHIRTWSNPGDLVFDPFLGSGTTACACLNRGRRFIGCEIDPDYFAIAQKRISEHFVTKRLF